MKDDAGFGEFFSGCLGIDTAAIHKNFKISCFSRSQGDSTREVRLKFFRQTDGTGFVISDSAIEYFNMHVLVLGFEYVVRLSCP